MVEYRITDTELILFLESNNKNLEIYTDEYFVYFDIHADIHMVKKGAGIIKGGSENANEDPTRIQLPYKFFYDKMMYIDKAIKSKWGFPQTSEDGSSSSLSMYDKFQNAINARFNKDSSNGPMFSNEDSTEDTTNDTNKNILFDKASDIKSSLYGKFEKIMDNIKLKENVNSLLSITPVELNQNQKQPLPEPFLKPEEDNTQLPEESVNPVAEEESSTSSPTEEVESPEEPVESPEEPLESPEEEEYNEENESLEGEPRIQYPEKENSFQLYDESFPIDEHLEEKQVPVEEESQVMIPPSDTKLKITIPLKGEQAVHIEKEKLYKHKPIYSHMKQLLKKGVRWENIEGFFIGDKIFVIGNYTKDCKKKTTPFDQKEFENTELYKLIKESECTFF